MRATRILPKMALLLAVIVLFQSCTVYKKGSFSLSDAVNSETKVKVEYLDKSKAKYSKVISFEDNYYGVIRSKVNGTWTEAKIIINEQEVSEIWLKNKEQSTFISIFGPIVIVGILVLLAYQSIENSISLNWNSGL